jgi:hypothetical protein
VAGVTEEYVTSHTELLDIMSIGKFVRVRVCGQYNALILFSSMLFVFCFCCAGADTLNVENTGSAE